MPRLSDEPEDRCDQSTALVNIMDPKDRKIVVCALALGHAGPHVDPMGNTYHRQAWGRRKKP